MHITLVVDGVEHDVVVLPKKKGAWAATIDGVEFEVQVAPAPDRTLTATVDGTPVVVKRRGRNVELDGQAVQVVAHGVARGAHENTAGTTGEMKPPMPGRIKEVLVKEGDDVTAGQAVIVLEAMKMQNELGAPGPGRVVKVLVKAGQTVETKDVLMVIDPH